MKIQLNKHQKEAVEFDSGTLLVVAGAGTGKTRVITERIKHLIDKKGVSPESTLALTFTEKAAKEMVNRLDDVMPLGYVEPWIHTFHSFSDRVLRESGLEIGLDTSYKIIPYTEQWLLLRRHLFSLDLAYFRPLGNPTKFISAILKFFSRLQDESITSAEFREFVEKGNFSSEESSRWKELAYLYDKYTSLKIEESLMDFGDLINWCLRLFIERPNILQQYQNKFTHVLVDEFQDTNISQYELIKLLYPAVPASSGRSLVVVGDDSQSIYKFRGAAISNILEFKRDYANSRMVTLNENYRSVQEILDPSYELVQNNNPDTLESKLGISKKLVSAVSTSLESRVSKSAATASSKKKKKETVKNPRIVYLDTAEDEVTFVVSEIIKLLGTDTDLTYKDIAILARANNHLDPFVMGLRKEGIPYQLVGNRGLYDREEIRDVVSLLRVVINPYQSIDLYRVLNIDAFEVDPGIIAKLLSSAKFKRIDLWDLIENSRDEKISYIVTLIKKYQKEITDKTPMEFVYTLVNESGYLKAFTDHETVENALSIRNLDLLASKIKQYEADFKGSTNEIPTVVDFLDYLDLSMEAGENPAQAEIVDVDTVSLMTVHASKGLEYAVVFMVNLISGRFPTRRRGDDIEIPEELIKEILPTGDYHIQEERRLFYVGMTRAKRWLYLTAAKNYGGVRDTTISAYTNETGLEIEQDVQIAQGGQEGLFGVTSGYRDAELRKIYDYIPNSLSYSKMQDYETCHLKYKYKYVVGIPTPQNHALSFGSTIHDTVRDYYAKVMYGQQPSYEDLLQIYKKNWNPVGYKEKKHQKLAYEKGKEVLKNFYEDAIESGVVPVGIEKGFGLKIGDIKFTGRIDRIDAGEKGTVEIIDYKTGASKTQKDVDKDDQLAYYAMAARDAYAMRPSKLTYYYLETGEKLSTTREDAELEEKKEKVLKIAAEIKSGNFDPTPGRHCDWCDFNSICPHAYKG